MDCLPDPDILTPSGSSLVSLPYQPEVLLCKRTLTRWVLDGGELHRDVEGEEGWLAMAGYVGKTYKDVFMDSYNHAVATRSR